MCRKPQDMNDNINETIIPWNDDTRDKIYEIRSRLRGIDIGNHANHEVVQAAIRRRFPQVCRHQDMYAVYAALASDLTKVKQWEDILIQFMLNDTFAIWEDDGENERLSCICAKKGLTSTFGLKNLTTGVVLNVGSICVFKNCITEKQKEKHKEMRKKVESEIKRRRQERENFICCNKCKEYVIPRRAYYNTICFDCRLREGNRKCPCCGYYRIKENTTYKRCFECYKKL
jgi:hypothetical protein